MPTAMRMVTTIVPVWVCTTNYGIPLFYSRIIKKKRLFVKCAIKCKIPRLFSRGITILEGFCVVLIYWLTHGQQGLFFNQPEIKSLGRKYWYAINKEK